MQELFILHQVIINNGKIKYKNERTPLSEDRCRDINIDVNVANRCMNDGTDI